MPQGGTPRLRWSVMLAAGLIFAAGMFAIRDLAGRTERRLLANLPNTTNEVTTLLDERLKLETNPNRLLRLAEILAKANELPLARQVASEASRRYPASRDINLVLAWLLAKSNEPAAARAALATAAQLDPLDPTVQELQAALAPHQSSAEAPQ